MIVLDIETSGLYPEKNGIWQIGAIELDNPKNQFLQESHIDEDEEVRQQALNVIGKIESQLRDKTKQSQKELLQNFFKWVEKAKMKNCLCQNPQFDLVFISQKARKYNLEFPIHYRAFDLHSIAAIKYHQINKKWLLSENLQCSGMGLSKVLEFCGIQDHRISTDVKTGAILRPGVPHNALEDAKLTAECFSRIVYGKELLPEFKSQPIPKYLLSL